MARPVHGGNLAWAARLAGCAPAELLDFSASISPLGPPGSVFTAIQAAFSQVREYPDPDYGDLRLALANYHQIAVEAILPGNGAAELLTWAARDLAQMPGGCARLVPAFGDYDRALQAFGCQLWDISVFRALPWQPKNRQGEKVEIGSQDRCTERNGFEPNGWDSGGQQRHLRQCGLLLNNPHNPTGVLISKEVVRSQLSQFGLVVVDEAFMDFVPPDKAQSVIGWLEAFPNLVVLRSLTKFYSMPGLRLGYAIAHPKTLERWRRWRDPWPVNTLAAAAGIAAVQDLDFQQRTWAWVAGANRQLYEGLSQLPGLRPFPGCVNFLLVACDCSVSALQRALLERHRIYIRDCLSFPELGDRYFRVAVKTFEENQRLIEALKHCLAAGLGAEEGRPAHDR